jgi:3-oxoacyl-[acyl-carrier protein] reductase
MRLANKVAIVTAAAGAGIGQATARALAREGVHVIVSDAHARRPFAVAEEIASSSGVKAVGIQCDVSNRVQVENMIELALKEFGRIDILVNNAGTTHNVPVVEMTDEVWELVINVNLKGTFYCSRAVLPTMIQQRSGRIINLSSAAAWMGSDEGAHYCAAKAGIMGFTRRLAKEVAPYNITVNAIAPGFIWNEFLAKTPGLPPGYFDEIRKQIPLGRDGRPEDVANAIVFLSSEEASYITGQTLCISGGWYMH